MLLRYINIFLVILFSTLAVYALCSGQEMFCSSKKWQNDYIDLEVLCLHYDNSSLTQGSFTSFISWKFLAIWNWILEQSKTKSATYFSVIITFL